MEALPFLGDDIFVLIAAELDARMLGRLGCAAQRLRRPSVPDPAHTADDPAPPEQWSVVEEGARRRLAAQSEQVRGWVCRGGVGGSWLRALGEAEKLQRPLRFTAHHAEVQLSEEGTVATGGGSLSAVCGGHEMRRGRHYATFTLSGLRCGWEGQPEEDELTTDDVVGLLLDLDAATLTVWVNGERKGVMARPGMVSCHAGRNIIVQPTTLGRLQGPLRWAVDLYDGSVAISGPMPPPA